MTANSPSDIHPAFQKSSGNIINPKTTLKKSLFQPKERENTVNSVPPAMPKDTARTSLTIILGLIKPQCNLKTNQFYSNCMLAEKDLPV